MSLPFISSIAVFVGGTIAVQGFSTGASLDNILELTAVLAVAAGGQTLVIIGGGIDLSMPWVITGSGILTSYLANGQDANLVWVIPLVLGLSVLVGLGNGLGVTLLGIPPIVMTLAMNVALSGAVTLYGSRQARSGTSPDAVTNLLAGHTGSVPSYVFVLLITTLLFSIILSFTRFGRRLYAIGTSPVVSRFSGVNVRVIATLSYVLSSLSAAVAGILLLGYVVNAYFGMGDTYLFASISAAVVGGASILGGSGHFIGTIGGALLLTVANALLVDLSLGPGAIAIFYGAIILASVIALSDRVQKGIRRARRGAGALPERAAEIRH
jgi:ribose transport system permease protein